MLTIKFSSEKLRLHQYVSTSCSDWKIYYAIIVIMDLCDGLIYNANIYAKNALVILGKPLSWYSWFGPVWNNYVDTTAVR